MASFAGARSQSSDQKVIEFGESAKHNKRKRSQSTASQALTYVCVRVGVGVCDVCVCVCVIIIMIKFNMCVCKIVHKIQINPRHLPIGSIEVLESNV